MTDIEREREAVILNLVAKNQGAGKVKIQKECYFLQEALGIPLGFEFVMYHYGPYSSELDDIIEEFGARGILSIKPYGTSAGHGYAISLGPSIGAMPSVPSEVERAIDRVANLLGRKDAKEVELWATTHFVHSILKSRVTSPTKNAVVDHVKKLKPKFKEQEISGIFDELKESKLLK